MKKYFKKDGRFSNEYSLIYTETDDQATYAEKYGYERITYKKAYQLCREEKDRRKYDPAFSGYAPTEITPFEKF